MPTWRRLQATFILTLACTGYGAPVWPAADSAGAPTLREALKALQAAGLNLVFSTTLVEAEFRVVESADSSQPLVEQARVMLRPFQLTLARRVGDVWYVTRAPTPQAPPPAASTAALQRPILEEVVVSSPHYRLRRHTHRRERLEARELDIMPSIGRDLLRSVNHLPGQASVGVSARNHMRGGNTNEVLYLVDGVQLIEPFHMADFHALFSAISPALVESVEVYHAGFPAAYGTRLSGVVDMELTQTESPLEGRLNVDFVNAFTQAQGFAGDTHWLVSARRSTVDHLLDHVEQDYGRPKFHDELFRLSRQGETTDFTVGMLYGNDELTLEDFSAGELARADYNNLASWVRASHTVSDSLTVDVSGSFTAIDNQRLGYLDAVADAMGSLKESRQFTVASLRSAIRWQPSDRWLVHAGLEAQRQDADFDVDIETHYGVLGEPLQPAESLYRQVAADRDGTLLTAFLSARGRISEAVTVEYGWRFDVQNIEPVHDAQFSPRVQFTYDDGERWRAFLNLGRYTQHQNLYELQLDDGLLELNDPQLADQLSVGAGYRMNEQWRLRLEAYWREIGDPWPRFENLYNRWVLLPELHADRIELNADQARTFGGELVVDYTPRDNLRWSLSVALARAEERIGGEWRPRPWEQRRTLRGGLDWRPGSWRLGLAAAWHTGWPTTSLVREPLTDFDRLYDRELPHYLSLDLHAARRFELRDSVVEVYFDLTNATFAENVGGYRYQWKDGALTPDDRLLLPPVPVLGLSWSW